MNYQAHQLHMIESIGALAGSVANDFANILTVIIGACSLLEMNSGECPEQTLYVSRIRAYAERAAQINQNLITASGRRTFRYALENLAGLLAELHGEISRNAGPRIDVAIPPHMPVMPVMIDRRQLTHVLCLLAGCARSAMPEGGTLHFRLERICHDGSISVLADCLPGEYVRLSVRDSGAGVEDGILSGMYDSFGGTRESDACCGLEFPLVSAIIAQHGGAVEAQSGPGDSTAFSLYLPLAVRGDSWGTPQALPGGTETILLVMADKTLLDLNRALLEEVGYLVLSAHDTKEALELYRVGRRLISLVILDTATDYPGGDGSLLAYLGDAVTLLLHDRNTESVSAAPSDRITGMARSSDPVSMLRCIRALLDGNGR